MSSLLWRVIKRPFSSNLVLFVLGRARAPSHLPSKSVLPNGCLLSPILGLNWRSRDKVNLICPNLPLLVQGIQERQTVGQREPGSVRSHLTLGSDSNKTNQSCDSANYKQFDQVRARAAIFSGASSESLRRESLFFIDSITSLAKWQCRLKIYRQMERESNFCVNISAKH